MCSSIKNKTSFSEIEILREFVALVDDLNSSALTRNFLSTNLTVRTRVNSWSEGVLLNFDEDSCRSFLLMFRLLYQPNDGISLRSIRILIWDGDYEQSLKDWVSFKRQLLDWELDSEAPFSEGFTYRQLIEIFLWGAYAHRCQSPDKRRQFLEWQAETETFVIRKQSFLLALKMMLQFADELAKKVCEVLTIKS